MNVDFRKLLRTAKQDGTPVLVIGLGRSGYEAAKCLRLQGLSVHVLEAMSEANFVSGDLRASYLSHLRELGVVVSFECRELPPSLEASTIALCLVSPGVPFDRGMVKVLRDAHVPISNELELGLELRALPYVLVTGSNGKSTTVSLVSHFLAKADVPHMLCGNIGIPVMTGLGEVPDLLETAENISPSHRFVVVEASSYQIESSNLLKPKVAAFLNISENHLERHGSLEYYFYLKSRAFMNQGNDDISVLNVDDSKVVGLRADLRSRVLGFGKSSNSLCGEIPGTYFDYRPRDGVDVVSVYFPEVEGERYDLRQSPLLGEHNRWNIAAAILMARVIGASQACIQDAISSFQPLEHRIEFIASDCGPTFINDSKATTPISAYSALRSVCEARRGTKVHMMLGGQLKASGDGQKPGKDWEKLNKFLRKKNSSVASVIFFGKDGKEVQRIFEDLPIPSCVCPSLKDAVALARTVAESSELVLFSPGCASFDEFTDFEQRGNVFKSLVGRR